MDKNAKLTKIEQGLCMCGVLHPGDCRAKTAAPKKLVTKLAIDLERIVKLWKKAVLEVVFETKGKVKYDEDLLRDLEDRLWKDLEEKLVDGVDAALRFGVEDAASQLGIEIKFSSIDKDIIAVLEKQAVTLSELTAKKLNGSAQQALLESQRLGENLQQTIDRLRASGKLSQYEAERIARTELSKAANTARLQGYKGRVEKVEVVLGPAYKGGCECAENVGVYKVDEAQDKLPPYHPNCLAKDTDIYTRRGWINIAEASLGDECLSLNPDTFDLEWVKVVGTVRGHEDKMLHLHSRNFDACVSADHNMFVENRRARSRKFVRADKLTNEHVIPRSCNWKGENSPYIEVAGKLIKTEAFCAFMGYYLSEGCVSKRGPRSYQIAIAQQGMGSPKRVKMLSDLIKLPYKVNQGKRAFLIYDPELGKYLQQFGKSHEKHIPDVIKCLSPYYIRFFLDAYNLGDGSIRKGKPFKEGNFRDTMEYFTSSEKMSSDLGELILKAGHRPSYRLQKSKGVPVEHHNGIYSSHHDMWRISECYSAYAGAAALLKDCVDYNDEVFCVTLEKYHTIWIRRHGKTSWTGNCDCWIRAYFDDSPSQDDESAA